MTPSEAASIAAVAGIVRRKILRGEYADGKVSSRMELAAEFGISPESTGIVLRMMRDEGLVDLRQGSGTFVRQLRTYRVTVAMTGKPGDALDMRRAKWVPYERRMAAAEKAQPAVADLDLSVNEDQWEWSMTVRSADPARAGLTALAATEQAAGPGWDVPSASVSIKPVL